MASLHHHHHYQLQHKYHLRRRTHAAHFAVPSMPKIRRQSILSTVDDRPSMATNSVGQWIEANLGTGKVVKENFQGGSGWSSTYTVQTKQGATYFVKTARGQDDSMFKGEALGLQAMYDTQTIRVPKVLHYGPLSGPGQSGTFIVMECLDLRGREDQAELGRSLARMHMATPKDPNAAAGKFGFPVDNTIGATPQPNKWTDNWIDFYREQRLGHMIQLAGDAQLKNLGRELLPNIDVFFEGLTIKPSVLHGDLWSGNIGAANGKSVIFDPATYYGHHEAEFGMSWCAGFSNAFWQAYHEVIPRAAGWEERHQLYTLYHYLNHYVLFGGGYYGSCTRIMNDLLKKVKK